MGEHQNFFYVSVVVRRMYYWDSGSYTVRDAFKFVSVVVRRMYYWDPINFEFRAGELSFSSC